LKSYELRLWKHRAALEGGDFNENALWYTENGNLVYDEQQTCFASIMVYLRQHIKDKLKLSGQSFQYYTERANDYIQQNPLVVVDEHDPIIANPDDEFSQILNLLNKWQKFSKSTLYIDLNAKIMTNVPQLIS